jgi:hypothetical protein
VVLSLFCGTFCGVGGYRIGGYNLEIKSGIDIEVLGFNRDRVGSLP